MLTQKRQTVANVLGYRIERVANHDNAAAASWRYEVLAPESGNLLGSFKDRTEAERHIVRLELSSLDRPARAVDRGATFDLQWRDPEPAAHDPNLSSTRAVSHTRSSCKT